MGIESLNKYRNACDDELQGKIQQARSKNELIRTKMISVYGKFEEYLSTACAHDNCRGLVRAEHETLNQKYDEQLS